MLTALLAFPAVSCIQKFKEQSDTYPHPQPADKMRVRDFQSLYLRRSDGQVASFPQHAPALSRATGRSATRSPRDSVLTMARKRLLFHTPLSARCWSIFFTFLQSDSSPFFCSSSCHRL